MMVLPKRVIAAIPIASLICWSVAPFAFAALVWKYTQYSHGICAATASPISSLVLLSRAVFGLN